MLRTKPHGFGAWAVWLLRATAPMTWGLFMASLGGIELLREHPTLIPTSWKSSIELVWFLLSIWVLVIFWIPSGIPKNLEKKGEWPILLCAVAVGFLAWQDRQSWAMALVGPVCALFFWFRGKVRGQLLLVSMFGWILASIIVFRLPWPNQDRFGFVFVLGGLATALDGVLVFVGRLRNLEESAEHLSPDHP